jgi:cysteine desulfurase/selenocysteine lyase
LIAEDRTNNSETFWEDVRNDFPVLRRDIAYLDSAATSQAPRVVIEAVSNYLSSYHSNVHRAAHRLSMEATDAYEGARSKVAKFLKASRVEECIFVRGATEGINLVANAFLRPKLNPGDEIVLTALEHHANIIPWQLVAKERQAKLVVVPLNEEREVSVNNFAKVLSAKTKFVALSHGSNVLGSILPVLEMTALARKREIPVLLDSCQTVPHIPVDVESLGCDFLVFSGHKVYGPTGIGVLWGKYDRLVNMEPYMGGGQMILHVTFEESTYALPPNRFEAGTPAIAQAIGLGAALDYVSSLGLERISERNAMLNAYAWEALEKVKGFQPLKGTPKDNEKVLPIIAFNLEKIHHHDVAVILDTLKIAVRGGNHCAQPLMKLFNLSGCVRASFSFYNTFREIDTLIEGLREVGALID